MDFDELMEYRNQLRLKIEKRSRERYNSMFGVTIDTSAVDEWRVESFTERQAVIVYWTGTRAMIGDKERYYDHHEIKSYILYEDLELTENEFNERYPVCQK